MSEFLLVLGKTGWPQETRMMVLPGREKSPISLAAWIQYMNVREGQTYTSWQQVPPLYIISCGKNPETPTNLKWINRMQRTRQFSSLASSPIIIKSTRRASRFHINQNISFVLEKNPFTTLSLGDRNGVWPVKKSCFSSFSFGSLGGWPNL